MECEHNTKFAGLWSQESHLDSNRLSASNAVLSSWSATFLTPWMTHLVLEHWWTLSTFLHHLWQRCLSHPLMSPRESAKRFWPHHSSHESFERLCLAAMQNNLWSQWSKVVTGSCTDSCVTLPRDATDPPQLSALKDANPKWEWLSATSSTRSDTVASLAAPARSEWTICSWAFYEKKLKSLWFLLQQTWHLQQKKQTDWSVEWLPADLQSAIVGQAVAPCPNWCPKDSVRLTVCASSFPHETAAEEDNLSVMFSSFNVVMEFMCLPNKAHSQMLEVRWTHDDPHNRAQHGHCRRTLQENTVEFPHEERAQKLIGCLMLCTLCDDFHNCIQGIMTPTANWCSPWQLVRWQREVRVLKHIHDDPMKPASLRMVPSGNFKECNESQMSSAHWPIPRISFVSSSSCGQSNRCGVQLPVSQQQLQQHWIWKVHNSNLTRESWKRWQQLPPASAHKLVLCSSKTAKTCLPLLGHPLFVECFKNLCSHVTFKSN